MPIARIYFTLCYLMLTVVWAPVTASKMAEHQLIHRRILQSAIGALCCEQGFTFVSKMALETLTEMTQSFFTELSRTSKSYCELSAREKPTLSDVKMALIDLGINLDEIPLHARRSHRMHLTNPQKARIVQNPKALEAGSKQARPSYIPSHLPSFPDPHSYIKTPTFRQSEEEYKEIREKYAAERKDIEKGLARFLAKTAESKAGMCTGLDESLFPLIKCDPPPLPYLPAILSCEEDEVAEDDTREKRSSTNLTSLEKENVATSSDSSYENPFLRTAKRPRKSSKTTNS